MSRSIVCSAVFCVPWACCKSRSKIGSLKSFIVLHPDIGRSTLKPGPSYRCQERVSGPHPMTTSSSKNILYLLLQTILYLLLLRIPETHKNIGSTKYADGHSREGHSKLFGTPNSNEEPGYRFAIADSSSGKIPAYLASAIIRNVRSCVADNPQKFKTPSRS